ncbi:hypothetical protein GCM10027184_31580 [Saccharothrix stipae]
MVGQLHVAVDAAQPEALGPAGGGVADNGSVATTARGIGHDGAVGFGEGIVQHEAIGGGSGRGAQSRRGQRCDEGRDEGAWAMTKGDHGASLSSGARRGAAGEQGVRRVQVGWVTKVSANIRPP